MLAARALVVGAVAVFVALLMVSPGGSGLGASPLRPSSAGLSAATAAHGSPSSTSATESRILSELRSSHTDLKDAFLPNLNAPVRVENGTIVPTYAMAPAPMGIGDFGIQEVHGKNVGTVSYTSSVEASITLNALNSTYLDGFGPDSVSMQLNTVLTNVDLFGNTQNQFWVQNVPVYVESTHKLYIVDNIWNFSSPAFDLTANSLYRYHGIEVPPVYYFANGPQWTTGEPFTVRVFNNATVLNDRPTVFLNYSVTLSNGTTVSGSYDRVEFNSTGLARPTHPAPMPTFQIDGQHYGAQGYLPNDAEIMIGGSGDGSTTSVSDVNATMSLATLPNASATYVPVPAAYNFGVDTGETSEGISEWASAGPSPVAHLASGPSILRPLWGLVGSAPGFVPVTFSVAPSNAFVFASRGPTFQSGAAAWAPVLANGTASYQLPPGHYAFEFLLSDHDTKLVHVSGATSTAVTLASDPSVGITTPLYAWGNAQLAAISQSGGTGTVTNPYVLLNGGSATLNPLFGEFNDFFFPVFSGIQLENTSAFVTVTNAPTFFVTYSLPIEAGAIAAYGLPTYNYLQQEYYNVHHVSVVDNPAISGWFSSFDIGTMVGSVLIWNSSGNLVAGNSFDDMSVALFVYGGTNNVVWGNTMTVSQPVCPTPSNVLNDPGNETGIVLSADHDLLYNNYFDVPAPAVTPTTNVLTFLPSSYHDVWNISSSPLHMVRVVNGFSLSGNIVGGSRQGGNFWSTYGTPADPFGVLPFNAAGGISSGGDQLPLEPFALHKVTFTEKGLPPAQLWSVTLNGVTFSTNGGTIQFLEPSGTYAYAVGTVAGFTANPASGAITVHHGAASTTIHWT
jgi:thermopsin